LRIEKSRSALQYVGLSHDNPKGDDPVALKTMSIDKLVKLRSDVEAMLAVKITEQRRALEGELSKLGGYGPGKKKSTGGGGKGSVAPKYRNPENPTETWAGRGLKPRWLAAAIKSGKKLEDFAIAKNGRGKGRKKAKK
jgi:DNA-binding protein H-NS